MTEGTSFTQRSRKPRPGTLALIVLLHAAAIYGIGLAFAPQFTASVQEEVLSAFTVTVETKDTPPEPEPEPDPGASGEEGRQATPKPVTAPEPPLVIQPSPLPAPKASSTGTANSAGAKEEGTGTGAGGKGTGTGSGNGGGGQGGGVPVTKPVHVSGGIDDARDYPVPPRGRSARRGNEVIVKVTVGTDGRASNCSVFRASPDAEADRLTCQLVVQRLRFKPATDSNGNPVAAPFYWRQRWF